jgi:hypothetical protein
MLQAGRFQIRVLFAIYIILWPWGRLSLEQKGVPEMFLWVDCLESVRVPMPHNSAGLRGLLQGQLYLYSSHKTKALRGRHRQTAKWCHKPVNKNYGRYTDRQQDDLISLKILGMHRQTNIHRRIHRFTESKAGYLTSLLLFKKNRKIGWKEGISNTTLFIIYCYWSKYIANREKCNNMNVLQKE